MLGNAVLSVFANTIQGLTWFNELEGKLEQMTRDNYEILPSLLDVT